MSSFVKIASPRNECGSNNSTRSTKHCLAENGIFYLIWKHVLRWRSLWVFINVEIEKWPFVRYKIHLKQINTWSPIGSWKKSSSTFRKRYAKWLMMFTTIDAKILIFQSNRTLPERHWQMFKRTRLELMCRYIILVTLRFKKIKNTSKYRPTRAQQPRAAFVRCVYYMVDFFFGEIIPGQVRFRFELFGGITLFAGRNGCLRSFLQT